MKGKERKGKERKGKERKGRESVILEIKKCILVPLGSRSIRWVA
jgi:hypothetical protein